MRTLHFRVSSHTFEATLDKEEIDVSKDGFSVSIRFVLSHLYDPIFDKYIFDMGQPEDWTNRFSIFIKNNRHIVAQITDENGIGLSLCCPIEAFQHEPKLFSFVICPPKASASIFVGSTLQKEVLGIPEHMLKTMNPGGSCITFNSLELVDPCPVMISYQSIGAAINAVSLSESIEKFCEAVTKSIG